MYFPCVDSELIVAFIWVTGFISSRLKRKLQNSTTARSANRTRGIQHVELCTRVHMGTPVCWIPPTLAAILTVHAAGLYPKRNVSGPDRADAHVQAVREVRHGPRTRRHVNRTR